MWIRVVFRGIMVVQGFQRYESTWGLKGYLGMKGPLYEGMISPIDLVCSPAAFKPYWLAYGYLCLQGSIQMQVFVSQTAF